MQERWLNPLLAPAMVAALRAADRFGNGMIYGAALCSLAERWAAHTAKAGVPSQLRPSQLRNAS